MKQRIAETTRMRRGGLVSAKQAVSHAAVLAQHTALTCVGTYVPIELPVVTCHESVTPLDRAWTWWGARSDGEGLGRRGASSSGDVS